MCRRTLLRNLDVTANQVICFQIETIVMLMINKMIVHLVVNECQNSTLNDCDKVNGECVDTLDSFVCRCRQGFVDELPSKPGRQCTNGILFVLLFYILDYNFLASCVIKLKMFTFNIPNFNQFLTKIKSQKVSVSV